MIYNSRDGRPRRAFSTSIPLEEVKRIEVSSPEERECLNIYSPRRSRASACLPKLSEVGEMHIIDVLKAISQIPESYFFGVPIKEMKRKLGYSEAYKYLSRLIVMKAGKQSDLARVAEG